MKRITVLLCVLFMCTIMQAQERIAFSVESSIIDKQPMGHGHPKSPIQPPIVYIEDYTLTFVAGHPDYELTIKDEDGETIYTTFVTSAMTLVTLPSTLTGDYVIELRMGYWLFTGWIEL